MNTKELENIVEQATARLAVIIAQTIGSSAFADVVAQTQSAVHELGLSVLELICREADEQYNAQRNRHEVIIKNKRVTRRLLTSMGELTLTRRLYYNKATSSYFFAVDNVLGIEKYARIEDGMKAELIANATRMSYGKSAETANNKVSRQTVHNIVRRIKYVPDVHYSGYKAPANIYIDADEDHIHLNTGKSAEVKLIYVHEGVRQVCKGRRELINPKYFASAADSPEDLWDKVYRYVHMQYKTSSAQIHISGDGAFWIKSGLEYFPKAIFHLDKFHIYKSITEAASGKRRFRREVIGALAEGQFDDVSQMYNNLAKDCATPKERKALRTSLFYLENNLDGIDLASQTSCSAEGHVSHVLSARLSSRPMAWSRDGAHRIATLRAFYFNGGNFYDIVRIEPQIPGVQLRHKSAAASAEALPSSVDSGGIPSANLVGLHGIKNKTARTLRSLLKHAATRWF